MKIFGMARTVRIFRNNYRRGIVLVVAAAMMLAILGLTALSVDLGYIIVIRSQMQTAVDAAALAAGNEIAEGYGVGAIRSPSTAVTRAQGAGQTIAAANRMLDRESAYLNAGRDLTFGKRTYNASTEKWEYQWGETPYDCVKATLHRDQVKPNNTSLTGTSAPLPDGPLNLFFARALGNTNASYKSTAIAALRPAVGVRLISNSSSETLKILPIALDQQTWANLISGNYNSSFKDEYTYNPSTRTVTSGADGIREVNIYPTGNSNLPPGNRGTVDIGSPNNSTADLSRQIRYGQNAFDMSYFPNSQLRFDDGPVIMNGDTGISAGIKDDLTSIIGQPRMMPLFTSVSGPGNNAMYTIPKLVGVRILYVRLTGSPSQKQVVVQPATYITPQAITSSTETLTPDSILGPARLVE